MELARSQGAGIARLTADNRRPAARRVCESLGLEAGHAGMKRSWDASAR